MTASAVATLTAAKICFVFIVDLLVDRRTLRGLHQLIRRRIRFSSMEV
jgi:hypothetical protein